MKALPDTEEYIFSRYIIGQDTEIHLLPFKNEEGEYRGRPDCRTPVALGNEGNDRKKDSSVTFLRLAKTNQGYSHPAIPAG
jgi:hypothetical protein